MSVLDTIASLLESAKRLRAIADDLGRTDVKARIVDEIFRLKALRGQAQPQAATAAAPEGKSKLPGLGEEAYTRLEPSADGETYSLTPLERGDEPLDEESLDADTQVDSDTKYGITATSDTVQIPTSQRQFKNLPEAERLGIAEQRLTVLEPLYQAAQRKLNGVLTPRQMTIKAAATKKGLAAGRKGKVLQDAVLAALQLTEDQQQRLAEARRELQQVRAAMAKEVEGLLSKEQLDRYLKSRRYR